MKNMLLTIVRVIVLAVVFILLLMVASSFTTPSALLQQMTPAQVSRSVAMLPVVSLIMTLILAYLALRSHWHGWKLAGALFVIFYTLYSLLGWVELLAFPKVANQMPEGMRDGLLAMGLLLGLPFSLLTVWILGKSRKSPTEDEDSHHLNMPSSAWAWKIAAGAVLYMIIYFTFGNYVAWRTPGLPEFYGRTDPGTFYRQLANLVRDTPWLFALQFFRGLIWTGTGCLIIRMLRGNVWEIVLATGLTFTVLMNTSLLIPNTFWPPAVAHAHAIELVSSNLLYGILLSALMLWTPTKQLRSIGASHPAH